ncbi:MAG: helix-hairpin-helix domain-containing protein [Acidobacteria bacterium]|nr:helix-hairpin-helix domain-containing protein [Acidobacteriota bacterium]
MKASDADLAIINDYLARNYPADAIPPVNINKANAIELESRLSLRRSQAAALLAYREKNGKFKTFNDLKQVPGLDLTKLEAKRAMIVFQ